ncbi:MAG: BspA family leucine-rich repeat surface protein [Bacilli bacterium]|nr:BspA family leucine-rich repeat surface protein [Bacilli bacterium]
MKKNKGFTLIELLAVIVILAVIALIATPLIMNIISEAKKGAFLDSSYAIVSAAEQGYAKGLIKETNLEKTKYTFNNGVQSLVSGNVELNFKGSNPEYGTIIIDDEGKVAINLYSGGFCSTKEYDTDVVTVREVSSKDECVTAEIVSPTIALKGYDIVLTTSETSYRDPGYIASDVNGIDVSSNVNITNNINYGVIGEYKITYSIIDSLSNTISVDRKVTVVGDEVVLKAGVSGAETTAYLNGPITKNKIESIKFVVASEVPSDIIGSWDVSASQDGSIMAWYRDTNSNGLYELTIGGDGKISANPSSNYLFAYLTKLKTIEFDNFDTSKVTAMFGMFYNATSLINIDLSNFDTSNVTNMGYMFNNAASLISLDLSSFDTSNVTSMVYMFLEANQLESLDLSNFNTSKVIDMTWMFRGMSSLTNLDISSFDTSNVTGMSIMFLGCSNLTSLDLSNFNTSKVTSMANMFQGMSSLTSLNLSSFDTSKVINMAGMFSGVSSLTNLDVSSFDTSNVTNMSSMFYGMSNLTALNVSNFNTSNVTYMANMFVYATSLTSLDLSNFDTSKVTNMSSMFHGMSNLTALNVSNFNTSNVTTMFRMFYDTTNLTNLNLSSFNTSKVTDMSGMFHGMSSLQTLDFRSATFASVSSYSSLFSDSKSGMTIYSKDSTTRTWLESRLIDSSISGTVTIAS